MSPPRPFARAEVYCCCRRRCAKAAFEMNSFAKDSESLESPSAKQDPWPTTTTNSFSTDDVVLQHELASSALSMWALRAVPFIRGSIGRARRGHDMGALNCRHIDAALLRSLLDRREQQQQQRQNNCMARSMTRPVSHQFRTHLPACSLAFWLSEYTSQQSLAVVRRWLEVTQLVGGQRTS